MAAKPEIPVKDDAIDWIYTLLDTIAKKYPYSFMKASEKYLNDEGFAVVALE